MEADIIIEGFKKADSFGIRYMHLIGDGDSSVFARIQNEVPVWGLNVSKLECANHVCKCLRGHLEKLVVDNPSLKGKGNLTQAARIRIGSDVRCAIRMRSQMPDRQKAITALSADIRNSVFHIFGEHEKCSDDFCKAKQTCNQEVVDKVPVDTADDNIDCGNFLVDQSKYWTEGASIEDQEESRKSCFLSLHDRVVITKVIPLLNRVADKSNRLIGNFTSNLCESWMHIRSKFDGGKVINHCNRFSWNTRCYAGGLRSNLGPQWVPRVWEKCTQTKPGELFEEHYVKKEREINTNNKSKATPNAKKRRWTKKVRNVKQSTSKKARREYGPEAIDMSPDVSVEVLERRNKQFLESHVNVSLEQIYDIEQSTRAQSGSSQWKQERKKRLTSSNLGKIIKRKPSLKIKPIVTSLLYSKFSGNEATKTGLEKEAKTKEEYIEIKKDTVKQIDDVGLVVSQQHNYLAASPDGKVICHDGDVGLIEINNILYNKPITLKEAANLKKIPNFCLEVTDGRVHLKKNHNYYFQCQGALNITGYEWLDFVMRTEDPYDIHIERIERDTVIWESMVSKLSAFFFNVILPELAAPGQGKCPGIREPGIWFDKKQKDNKRQQEQHGDNCTAQASTSQPSSSQPSSQQQCVIRARRKRHTKFLGRRIKHKWMVNEKPQWYRATVVNIVSGTDGIDAVYEVLYDNGDELKQINHLIEDFGNNEVTFIDV